MTWEILIPVIGKYSIELAESLWKRWASGQLPTQADWDDLKAMSNQTAKDRMLLALTRAGIDPNSDQGKALLALAV